MQLPKHFGKFILIDKLGQGGMAQVFLAQYKNINGVAKTVAIKIMSPLVSAKREVQDLMKSEAEVAINFSHANVGSMLEYGSLEGQFFLAMEYVSGKNLGHLIHYLAKAKTRLKPEEILYIISQAAAGIDYAHRYEDPSNPKFSGIIHRDISTDNIMISYEGEVKVIDFGVANVIEDHSETMKEANFGKIRYQAPEQISGGKASVKTDVFALGLVLWEACTGKMVYANVPGKEVVQYIKQGVIPRITDYNHDCPQYIIDIFEKATHIDPAQRYETAGDFFKEARVRLAENFPEYTKNDLRQKMQGLFSFDIQHEKQKHMTKPSDTVNYGREVYVTEETSRSYLVPVLGVLGVIFAAFVAMNLDKVKSVASSFIAKQSELSANERLEEVEKSTGTIKVITNPHGAHVILDGKVLGVTPHAIPAAGLQKSTLQLSLSGYKTEYLTIDENTSRIFMHLTQKR